MTTNFVKRLAVRLLPKSLLKRVLLRYHIRAISRFSVVEEPDLAVVKYLARPGEFVIDAGANLGIYTKFLSGFVGGDGRVLSFEPVPETHAMLERIARRLQLNNVSMHQCALSSEVSTVSMEVPYFDTGLEDHYDARIVTEVGHENTRAVTVRAETIDNFTRELQRPISFIKCDVEGHERECVAGAAATIERDHPSWLIEVSGNMDAPRSAANELVEYFSQQGYGVYRYDGELLRERKEGERSINFFFLRKEHLQRIKDAGLLDPEIAIS